MGGGRDYFLFGFVVSIVGHSFLVFTMLMGGLWRPPALGPEIIYSITLEGGEKLGGVTQVPSKDQKGPVAPPKAAQDAEVQEKPKDVTEPNSGEDLVQITEPTKAAPTPAPTPKKSAVPTKKPTPKKQPTPKPKEPSLSEIDKQLDKAVQRYLGESTDAGGKGFGAGKLGGKGMGGGVIQPPEFFRYRELLEYHVKKEWRWYDTTSALTARVVFAIAPDGKLSDVRIAESSGNSEFDKSAVRAVHKADPAPAPPETVYHMFKEVRMTFDPRQ